MTRKCHFRHFTLLKALVAKTTKLCPPPRLAPVSAFAESTGAGAGGLNVLGGQKYGLELLRGLPGQMAIVVAVEQADRTHSNYRNGLDGEIQG